MTNITFKKLFLYLLLLSTVPGGTAFAGPSIPSGGKTKYGDAKITKTANGLRIESKNRSVIEWDNFNIGRGKLVEFLNNKAVLNYVLPTGGRSLIDGNLTAKDTLILINPSGISVGQSAIIDVSSLLLSTASLRPDTYQKFLQGVDYASGQNAPLITLDLQDTSGSININGTIRSSSSGGIGVIAPQISFGPNAKISTTGYRNNQTGKDGVNLKYKNVEAEGTLWLGTTALSAPFDQPPGLPTGFGFVEVSGKPSPQDISIALEGTYDLERFVIGTTGATAHQFDDLFFSPSFRAHDFYLYDGVHAVAEGHRQATTSGSLERKIDYLVSGQVTETITHTEADILGLNLPAGAILMEANNVVVDHQSGELISGEIKLSPGNQAASNSEFSKHFGNGPVTIKINGTSSVLTGSNNQTEAYNLTTGEVAWSTTIQGQTTQQTTPIVQTITTSTTTKPAGLVGEGQLINANVIQLFQGHSWRPCQTANAGCKPTTHSHSIHTWQGNFVRNPAGNLVFVAGKPGQTSQYTVYQFGGRYYTVETKNFNPTKGVDATTLRETQIQVSGTQTTTTTTPDQTFNYSETIPITGTPNKNLGGPSTSHWERQLVAVGTYEPGPSGFSPVPQKPDPQTTVVTGTRGPSFTGYGPVPQQPDPQTTVVTGTRGPSFTGYGPVPQKPDPKPAVVTGTKGPSTTGHGSVPQKPDPKPAVVTGTQRQTKTGTNNSDRLSGRIQTPKTPTLIIRSNSSQKIVGYEYQIPSDVIDKLGNDVELTKAKLQAPGGRPLPAGISFEPFSETISIRNVESISLPLDVELSAPNSNGWTTIQLTIGEP